MHKTWLSFLCLHFLLAMKNKGHVFLWHNDKVRLGHNAIWVPSTSALKITFSSVIFSFIRLIKQLKGTSKLMEYEFNQTSWFSDRDPINSYYCDYGTDWVLYVRHQSCLELQMEQHHRLSVVEENIDLITSCIEHLNYCISFHKGPEYTPFTDDADFVTNMSTDTTEHIIYAKVSANLHVFFL